MLCRTTFYVILRRYELYSFFKTNYSANLMTVCIVHNEDLDQIEELAKEFFLRIKVTVMNQTRLNCIKNLF